MITQVDKLTTFEKDILLQWFLYHLPMGQSQNAEADFTHATRFAFMQNFPQIYNKVCGRQIVTVHQQPSA